MRHSLGTLLLALVVLCAADPDSGFVLTLLSPVLVLWFLRIAWVAWRQPMHRRAQAIKAGGMAALVAGIALLQGNWQHASRLQAQKTIAAIAAWRGQHGDYPPDLAQAGLDEEALRRDAHVWYVNRDGQHRVMYRAVFSVYDSYGYDLDKGRWFYSAE